MNTIYTAVDGYTITLRHGLVTIAKGAQTQKTRLTAARELSPSQIATVKKAGGNPADFFSNAENVIVRAAARDAWDAALAEQKAAAKAAADAERAAVSAEIADKGLRAIVFHGAYYLNTSLVWVRPATATETARFSADYRSIGLYRPLGDWTALHRAAADAMDLSGRPRHALTTMEENAIVLISEDEWDALLAASESAHQAERSKKAAKEDAEANRIAAAQAEAARTGRPVEIHRELIETETEDGLVLIRALIHGDGTRTTERSICG